LTHGPLEWSVSVAEGDGKSNRLALCTVAWELEFNVLEVTISVDRNVGDILTVGCDHQRSVNLFPEEEETESDGDSLSSADWAKCC
jgi:hypothetical protein